MDMRKQKLIAIGLIILALTGFFLSMHFLGLFGSKIEYTNINYILKDLVPLFFITIGMYGVGYVINGNKTGLQWIKWWLILYLSMWVIGYLARTYIPTAQPFLPLILLILVIAYISFRNKKVKREKIQL